MPIINRRKHARARTWDLADSRSAERLYRRSGIPNLIEGYAATTDILTRLSPLLITWFFFNVATATIDEKGQLNAPRAAISILVGVSVTVAVNAYFQVRAGRPWWSLPRRIGYLQLALWFAIPAVLSLTFGNSRLLTVLDALLGQAIVLGIVVFCSAFGVWSMIRWAFGQLWTHASSVTDVLLKTLPVMLLTVLFFFFTGETWQLMHNLRFSRFLGGLGAFAIFNSLLLFASVARASENLNRFDSWDQIARAAEGAGATNIPALADGEPPQTVLPRRVRFNIALVMYFAQALQATVVFLVVSTALVGIGVLFVRPATVKMWVTESPNFLFDTDGPRDHLTEVITAELVKVAFFIGAFASLMFSVGLSNANADGASPDEVTVLRDSVRHVREALAVRRLREQFGMCDQNQAKRRPRRRDRRRASHPDSTNQPAAQSPTTPLAGSARRGDSPERPGAPDPR